MGDSLKVVVMIGGQSGAGKDALADMIADELGRDRVLRCAFADPLKVAAQHLVGMPREVAYGSQAVKLEWKVYGKTARSILQILGTEVGRVIFHPNIWVDRLSDFIKCEASTRPLVAAVISDMRFWNEHRETPLRFQPIPVRRVLIWRPSALDLGLPPTLGNRIKTRFANLPLVRHMLGLFGVKSPKLMHPSEAEVWDMRQRAQRGEKLFDDFVVNDGTLEDLRAKAMKIARSALGQEA